MDRKESEDLLKEYVTSENLQHHCQMVALAMEGYAEKLKKPDPIIEQWWTAGLLHDIDWEAYPEEHPRKAVEEILPENGYHDDIINAVKTHAPERSGEEPNSEIERYLFACDELSGFMHAVSLMRPNGFSDMKVKSVTKKLKDKKFAANVPREDIKKGAGLISLELSDHIRNLIEIFKSQTI